MPEEHLVSNYIRYYSGKLSLYTKYYIIIVFERFCGIRTSSLKYEDEITHNDIIRLNKAIPLSISRNDAVQYVGMVIIV